MTSLEFSPAFNPAFNPASIYYVVTAGRRGCYPADQQTGALEFRSPVQLSDYVYDALDEMDFPSDRARQVDTADIFLAPTSFNIVHEGHVLTFHMLSEAEVRAMLLEDDR